MQYKFLVSPWKKEFVDIIARARKELFISSPYINSEGIRVLLDAVPQRASIGISLLTNLTTQNIVNGVTEPAAILKLHGRFSYARLSSLGRLHAKVYLIDGKMGIITSANLTSGGLINNFEYGVLIDDRDSISLIREDMSRYFSLGNLIDKALLERICEESSKLHKVREETQDVVKSTELALLLQESIDSIDLKLLRNRIKEKTVNTIFSDTILYFLGKKGHLATGELHPLIQSTHPDICDDSIDRVIDGQHFGKKWKHLVRNAQQALKKNGRIYLKDGEWRLTN